MNTNVRRMLAALATLTLALTTLGCGLSDDGEPWTLEEEVGQPLLSATFVSGHLGNYRDCEEGGFTASGTASDGAEPQGDAGACAPGRECQPISNCEDGQVTVQLTNDGDVVARGIQVTTLELFDSEQTPRAQLPLIEVVDTQTNTTFDGVLEPGESLNVRIVFLGPDNPYEFLNTDTDGAADRAAGLSGTLDISLTAQNHGKFSVTSGALYPVPSIDT